MNMNGFAMAAGQIICTDVLMLLFSDTELMQVLSVDHSRLALMGLYSGVHCALSSPFTTV
jgi:hypothetical protein